MRSSRSSSAQRRPLVKPRRGQRRRRRSRLYFRCRLRSAARRARGRASGSCGAANGVGRMPARSGVAVRSFGRRAADLGRGRRLLPIFPARRGARSACWRMLVARRQPIATRRSVRVGRPGGGQCLRGKRARHVTRSFGRARRLNRKVAHLGRRRRPRPVSSVRRCARGTC